mmetsp:Transcript_43045/g.139674  ORF Transcript_43045/g.139674 Transcript_43045/m.139674 type:complete len:338 (-) Transcript_43045:334-1347(-)
MSPPNESRGDDGPRLPPPNTGPLLLLRVGRRTGGALPNRSSRESLSSRLGEPHWSPPAPPSPTPPSPTLPVRRPREEAREERQETDSGAPHVNRRGKRIAGSPSSHSSVAARTIRAQTRRRSSALKRGACDPPTRRCARACSRLAVRRRHSCARWMGDQPKASRSTSCCRKATSPCASLAPARRRAGERAWPPVGAGLRHETTALSEAARAALCSAFCPRYRSGERKWASWCSEESPQSSAGAAALLWGGESTAPFATALGGPGSLLPPGDAGTAGAAGPCLAEERTPRRRGWLMGSARAPAAAREGSSASRKAVTSCRSGIESTAPGRELEMEPPA